MNLLGLQIVLTCQRTTCEERIAFEADEGDTVGTRIIEANNDGELDWGDGGWGFDYVGNDRVLHCGEHRE